jgi:hypothetical protein
MVEMAGDEVAAGNGGPKGATPTPRRPRRRKTTKAASARDGFYAAALSEAERLLLPEAKGIEGLDEEIALLRVRLHTAIRQHPENLPLLIKGVELLVKAVAARYRLSKRAEADLYQSVLGVLKGIGDALWPEGFPV